jgi:hypothetical protein
MKFAQQQTTKRKIVSFSIIEIYVRVKITIRNREKKLILSLNNNITLLKGMKDDVF